MQPTSSSASWPIAELIPHRQTMQLLTRILALDEQSLWASASTKLSRSSCWGIEYLGQATAAFFTLSQRSRLTEEQASQLEPPQGMLIGSRRYQMHRSQLPANAELLIQVSLQAPAAKALGASGLVKFRGTLWELSQDALAALPLSTATPRLPYDTHRLAALEGQPLAEGDLSVYIPAQQPPSN